MGRVQADRSLFHILDATAAAAAAAAKVRSNIQFDLSKLIILVRFPSEH